MSVKAEIARRAREMANSDVGNAPWSDDVKAKVLQTPESDTGFLAVASAVLGAARKEHLETQRDRYGEAVRSMEEGNYLLAQQIFGSLGDYSDSKAKALQAASVEEERIKKERYKRAEMLLHEGRYAEARKAFESLGQYSDASERASAAVLAGLKNEFSDAIELLGNEGYERALPALIQTGLFKPAEQPFERGDEIYHRLSGAGEIAGVEGGILHVRFSKGGKERQMIRGSAPIINLTYLRELLAGLG